MSQDKFFEKQLEQFGNEVHVRERAPTPARVRNEESTAAMIAVVKDLMNTVQGRQWLWEKLNFCSTFGFVCNPEQTHLNARFQGMQDVGMALYQEINAVAPDMILTMNQEAAQRNLVITKRAADEQPE